MIRRYDHEIGGGTVVRPLVGVAGDGPADGVVLADPRDTHGSPSASASTRGSACTTPSAWPTPSSTRRSATSSPSAPTPTRSPCSTTSRGATRAGRRRSASSSPRCAAAATRRSPTARRSFSGKDSLNNEYLGADGQRHAVPPTLVITAVAHVPDVGRVRHARAERRRATWSCCSARTAPRVRRQPPRHGARALDAVGAVPAPDPDAPARYRRLHQALRIRAGSSACHDLSEGGLAVALAEMAHRRAPRARRSTRCPARRSGDALFGESAGRFVSRSPPTTSTGSPTTVGEPVTCSARSPTSRRPAPRPRSPPIPVDRRSSTAFPEQRGRVSRPTALVLAAAGHQPRPRRRVRPRPRRRRAARSCCSAS